MKRLMKWIIPALALLITASCQSKSKAEKSPQPQLTPEKTETITKLSPQDLKQYETAYFASGCFWCVEVIFENVKGVAEVISGYSGGMEENPTYEQVSYGRTTHAEAVEVYYDPKIITFTELVQVFFGSHDPTTLNRQGPDRGPQYRSKAFYKNDTEKKIIEAYIQALTDNMVYDRPIVTEVTPFEIFYNAEDYHQDYERRNPDNPYIRNVSIPRYNRFKKNFAEYLKENAH
ncbi:MAG: peptide-methionine (S)-S-oxide reductase MsrA [Eudoraea sp.]|nr:peptide-methionine (S)-S-oxide reductase MsrA [Eudoraea sp.]